MVRIYTRRQRRGAGLMPAAIATPAAAAAGVAAGYVIFRRRPDGAAGASQKRVDEAMTRDPRSITPGAPIAEAARLMSSEDVGSLPVVDGGRLVGVVTDRDIACRVVAESRDPQVTTVAEVASGDVVTVRPEQDLSEALRLMAQHQVRRLPVVQNEQLVGIVAQADVALAGDDRRTGDVVQQVSEPASTPS